MKLWVSRIPTALAAVWDPDSGTVGAIEADDQLDVGVDRPPLVDLDGFMAKEFDRSVPTKINLGTRVPATEAREDKLREQLDERLRASVLSGVGAEDTESLEATVDLDPTVGILKRLFGRPVGAAPRREAGTISRRVVFLSDRQNAVTAPSRPLQDPHRPPSPLQNFGKE